MKNKVFIHQYKIQIKGYTTNNFTSSMFEDILNSLVRQWNVMHKTTQAEVLKEVIK
jgi:hypothetical protein